MKIAHKLVTSITFFVACFATNIATAVPPEIPLDNPNANRLLEFGSSNDAYWMIDNTWGANGLTEGATAEQFEQSVGVNLPVGPNGEVAFRMKWRWPQGTNEVKGYPAALSGKKPGLYSWSNLVNNAPVLQLDGNTSQISPSGATPNTFMPLQLPIPKLTATFTSSHASTPTGQGQLVFDIWLQSLPGQDAGFGNSSITHEIMIPLDNWGSYGSHPNGRNPHWYDHDAVINDRLYHVYATKGSDNALRFDFGRLNGNYGRPGWKMIAFVPDVLPVPAGEIDIAAFVNYIATRKDVLGEPWALGNEFLSSVELGVEPVVGSGDLTIYDYKLSIFGR